MRPAPGRDLPGTKRRPSVQPGEDMSAPPLIDVEVSDTQGHLAIDHAAVIALVRRVLAGEGVAHASISVALVDDAAIHAVNRRHLDHDCPTDVISFPFSEPGDATLSGELVVSAERAASMARRLGIDPWAELALYLVHGLLHLCGHDDLTAPAVDAMRRREGEILAREGLADTFPVDLAEAVAVEWEGARWSD